MAEEEKNTQFNLVPKQGEDKTFSLANYGDLSAQCDEFIKNNSVFTKIESPEDMKPCKEERKLLNERLKLIQQARLKVTDYYFGEFQNQCKELEKKLKAASDEHSASIHEQEAQMGKKSKAAIKLDIRTYDEKVAMQIEDFSKKLGAIVLRG